jgi:L-threonylcarbamoyladenylate synthase
MTRQRAEILQATNVKSAVDALCHGDIIGIPTETVYGLAGNAFDTTAVTKIFNAKERPSFDPLIVHVEASLKSASSLATAGVINEKAMTPGMIRNFDVLAKRFWPGPLTMILPKNDKISDLVTSGLDRVGVRMPAHPVAQEILRECGLPLAAPSANRFGRISPTTAQHVMDELGDRILFIVDGGPCEIGVESTVIAIDDDKIWLLRPGKISIKDLECVLDVPVERAPSVHEKASPGMLASHYAPRKPMYLISDLSQLPPILASQTFDLLITAGDSETALKTLALSGLKPVSSAMLSNTNDPAEVAKGLFAAMRTLDRSSGQIMIATSTPSEDGLWLAIADRLRRASTPLKC